MKFDKDILNKVLMAVVGAAAIVMVMFSVYSMGRNKGRDETVQMISTLADKYEFYVKDESGWTLGAAKGSVNYPEDFSKVLSYQYNEGKIDLTYNDID